MALIHDGSTAVAGVIVTPSVTSDQRVVWGLLRV